MKNIYLLFLSIFILTGCVNSQHDGPDIEDSDNEYVESDDDSTDQKESAPPPVEVIVKEDVPIRSYFKWMDSLVSEQNRKNNYEIDEYIIVHFNKWIMDTLAHTDYYYLMDKGIFSEDPQSLLALRKDQTLLIPDSSQTQKLRELLSNTYIDLNIPEFRLRIIQNGKELYEFPVRVGKNSKRYLAMAKRTVDLRTKPGIGEIVRVNKYPVFMNPVNNSRYYVTRRDDDKVTKLPAIPWLEPSVDGIRLGQLIHPTTNLATLNQASSNGCIGLRESDAWYVYYYAPLGTRMVLRYDLQVKDENGNMIQLDNIYPGFENIKVRNESLASAAKSIGDNPVPVCDCRVVE